MITKEDASEKVREGWLRVWFAFEALAVNEEVTKKSLENLLGKLETDQRIKIYRKEILQAKRVENPLPEIKEGWSVVSEVEFVCKKFDELVQVVMEFGPSAAEILEPKEMKFGIRDCQNVLNGVSDMMHRFAQAGIGGVIIRGE